MNQRPALTICAAVRRIALDALVSLACLSGAWAAEPDLVKRGQDIAAARCAPCHAIGPAGDSPQPIVPPFRVLHEDFPLDMLVAALTSGVVSGHDEMPMFDLGVADTQALIAYIDSLKPDGPQYLAPPAAGK
ncbi:MAG: cytochrome c [Hyphomicrobiaceae bacterium]